MFSLNVSEEEVLRFRRKWASFARLLLAFLHTLACCWNNSFWEPARDFITIKTKADFYFHSANSQDRRRGGVSSCTSLFFENVTIDWIVTYQHLKPCSKNCHITESGFTACWYFQFLLQAPAWMMSWVRVYALQSFLNAVSCSWSQWTAFSSLGCFEPGVFYCFSV